MPTIQNTHKLAKKDQRLRYSWPLGDVGVRGTNPQGRKSMYYF